MSSGFRNASKYMSLLFKDYDESQVDKSTLTDRRIFRHWHGGRIPFSPHTVIPPTVAEHIKEE